MIRSSFVILALMFCLATATVRTAVAADLKVTVIGLESDDGDVHIALYDTPEKFPESDGMVIEERPEPKNRTAQWLFKNLAPGRYAIATFHDANGNNNFDQGLFGVPLEDFGFSSGAKAFLSAPSFDDAAFTLPAAGLTITIDLSD